MNVKFIYNPFTGSFDPIDGTTYLPLTGGIITGTLEVSSSSGVTTLYIENGKVGINTETPNKELTIVGDISASGNLLGNNTKNWDSVYTTVCAESASWLEGGIDAAVRALTGEWDSVYTTVWTESASWLKRTDTDSLYLNLTGGKITGSLNVTDPISANGGQLIVSNTTTVPSASSILNAIVVTEAVYDSILIKDPNTLYVIV